MLSKSLKFLSKNLLFIILIAAFVLRFWNIAKYPEAIDEDEMALGYYGYSLIHNGTDEYGNRLPIYFQSVGDYKYGLYSYFAAIPIGIFGLTTTTTRLTAVISGTISIFAVYLLALEVFKKREYALITAFVLAVSPTHIHFSRVAYNNILGATLAIFSILFFIRYVKGKTGRKNVLLTLAFFVLSLFSYQAYRIFLPLSFVLIFFIYSKNLKGKLAIKSLLVVIISVAIVFLSFIPKESRARASGISTLTEQPKIVEEIAEDGYTKLPIAITRVFHNKLQSLSLGFVKRYVSYFDPKFLFVEVSGGDERHATPDVGLLYIIEAPLLLFGFLALGQMIKGKEKYIPLVLMFSAPVAASMVLDSTSITRSVISIYAFSLITALGIYYLINQKKLGKYFIGAISIFYLASLCYFIHQYTVHKVYHHPWYNDFGLKEMVDTVNQNYDKYSAVVVSAGHYMPFLFYNHPDPKVFISKSEFIPGGGVRRFDKIYFNMPDKCPLAGKKHVLYVCFGYQVPQNSRIVNVIYYRDGQPDITLIEFTGEVSGQKLPERLEYFKSVDQRFPNGIIPDEYASFWPAKN